MPRRTTLGLSLPALAALALTTLLSVRAEPQGRNPIILDPILELRHEVSRLNARVLAAERLAAEETKARKAMEKDITALRGELRVLQDAIRSLRDEHRNHTHGLQGVAAASASEILGAGAFQGSLLWVGEGAGKEWMRVSQPVPNR